MKKIAQTKLLLAVDIDGTLIPNSSEPPDIEGIKKFSEMVKAIPGVILIYPTGRIFAMACEAIRKYFLPMPDFLITDNGAAIYFHNSKRWEQNKEYKKTLIEKNPDFDSAKILNLLSFLPFLQAEENKKQDELKAGFYLDLKEDPKKAADAAQKILAENKIWDIKIIYSQDLKNKVGILEILPDNVSKLTGIRYLSLRGVSIRPGRIATRQSRDIQNSPAIIFAGDEGNDLDVFASGIPSILVGNARPEIKAAVREMGLNSVYFAEKNEVEGVIEGVKYFLQ